MMVKKYQGFLVIGRGAVERKSKILFVFSIPNRLLYCVHQHFFLRFYIVSCLPFMPIVPSLS